MMTARDYAEWGAYDEAVLVLGCCTKQQPMLLYYKAYYLAEKSGSEEEARLALKAAEEQRPDYCFPNKLEDIAVLQSAIDKGCHAKAPYYLGNLYYDKLQWKP
jgi:hypothetical protein